MEDGPTVDSTQIVPNTKPLCQQQQQVPLLYNFSKVVTLRTKNLIAANGPTVDSTQIVPNTKPLCQQQQQQQQVPLLYHFSKVVTLRTKNLIAAKEATFVYHTVTHDLSFKTADCSMKLIS
jgi:arginine decarboxylase-like protein